MIIGRKLLSGQEYGLFFRAFCFPGRMADRRKYRATVFDKNREENATVSKRGANIHKRKDGRWEGRYWKERKPDGSIHYGSVYGKSYREAKEKMIAAARNGAVSAPTSKGQPQYFRELLELWMCNNQIRQKGGTTAKYQFMIDRHLIPDLGNVRIADLHAATINSYLNSKLDHGRIDHKGGLSASYVRTITVIIHSVMKFAAEEGLCSSLKSPIFKPALVRQDLPILSMEQQRSLERHMSANMAPINTGIMLSLHAGLRIGEVCALSWEDVDFDERVIHVRHTVARVPDPSGTGRKTRLILDAPKTKSSIRDIPISSVLLPVLGQAKSIGCSNFVVSEEQGFTSPRTFEYRYYQVLKKCGIEKINYHALRHTFATRCIEVGVDVKSLSEMLGHANSAITLETYVHSSLQLKRAQLEKLAAASA